MRDRLEALVQRGVLELAESSRIESGEVTSSGACRLHMEGERFVDADRVWLATGTETDIHALRCLRPLAADIPTLDGLPCVDDRLRLGPHPVYVMGRLATLPLGPASGNLWGAQRAARRITQAITGIDLDLDTIAAIPSPTHHPSSPHRPTTGGQQQ